MATSSVVTRLQQRRHSFGEAVEAFRNGSFELCANSLRFDSSVAATSIRARALIRLGLIDEAGELIDAVILRTPGLSHIQLGELLTLKATVESRRSSQGSDIQACFSEARVFVYASASAALEAEFLSRESYAYLWAGDLETAELRCRAVLEIHQGFRDPIYFSPLEQSWARAHDALAFIAARREQYDLQRYHTKLALDLCDASGARDVVFEANLLTNLALSAIDFGDDGYVAERLDRTPEFDWLAPQRYEILRSLAWSNALRGDYLGAFRYLRDAGETANTIPRRMRATLDRAYFARQLKQDLIAREELDFAERLSARVDWNDVASKEGELVALAFLSQELACKLPVRARRLFVRYKTLKAKLPPNVLASCDRRARAEELGVDATISKAEGNDRRAIDLFLEAFNIWDSLGYGVRAALVARELATLGAGHQFSAYLAREASIRPRAWFASMKS
jgi:hypothetical protein